ncbi:MAG: hypothetical protein V3T20_10530, partial [Gemmatimonadota bacterium]
MSAARFRETWRDAARAIDRRPGEGWRDQLFHHGFRVLVVIAIAVTVPLFFRSHTLPETVDVEAGAVATEDVIAEFEFTVPKPAEQLARERDDAVRAVLPVYILDAAATDTALAQTRLFFALADSVFGTDPVGVDR